MIFRDSVLSLKRIFSQRGAKCRDKTIYLSFVLSLLPVSRAIAISPDPAAILPSSTPYAITVSAKPEDWAVLEQFELFAKISRLTASTGINSDGLGNPAGFLFAPPGTDYATELAPWIGEQVVLATLPDTTPRSIAVNDLANETVIVVPVADESKLAPFLEKLESARPEAPQKSTYKGAQLWVWPTREESYYFEGNWEDNWEGNWQNLPEIPHEEIEDFSKSSQQSRASVGTKAAATEVLSPPPEAFEKEEDYYTYTIKGQAVAKIDGYLIFAPVPETLKKLLDYHQFDYPRLSDSDLFLKSGYGAEEGAIARIYSNLSEVAKFNLDGGLGLPTAPSIPSIPGIPQLPGIPRFPTVPSLTFAQENQALLARALEGMILDGLIYPQAEGLRLQGRVYGNNLIRSNATPELPYADSALNFVPAPTYALNSGRDIAGLWEQLARQLSRNATARGYLEQARSTATLFTGLDLDTELFGWMDREFVLFFFPSQQGLINSLLPGTGVEIGMAIQTSDRPTAQKVLDTFDDLSNGLATSTTINNEPAVSWQAPEATTTEPTSYLSHSWISEDTVVITSGAGAMAQLLNNSAFEPISEHPTFINATGSLATPNNGYSYFNAGSTFSLAYALVSKWLQVAPDDPTFQQVKSYLGTLRGSGATTSSTEAYWQLDSLLNLAPAEPSP